MVLAQYYDDEDAAERNEAARRREARAHGGRVERREALTIVWRYGQEGRFAERVRDRVL